MAAPACRKSSFRQAGRLPRNVQDDLFFVPKAYKGTPSGQKKVKTILKSHKVRHFVRFSVKIKLDNYLFFIVVKSVLLLLCVYRQSGTANGRPHGLILFIRDDDACLSCLNCKLRSCAIACFFHNHLNIVSDGVLRYTEPLGNFGIGKAHNNLSQNLDFPF